MKKFPLICIIITTLISLFFFGQWINDIRPRYEWQEKIEEFNSDQCRAYKLSGTIICDSDYFGILASRDCDYIENDYRIEITREKIVKTTNHFSLCYKKEWVRIE